MKPLEKTLSEIDAATEVANKNLELLHPNVRPAFAVAIREAAEKLPALQKAYKETLFSNAVVFCLSGDSAKVEAFTAITGAMGNVFHADAQELYVNLAKEVEPVIGGDRLFSLLQLHHLTMAVADTARGLGMTDDLNAPQLGDAKALRTSADVVEHVRTLCTNAFGESVNAKYILSQLSEQAVKARFIGNVFAAVIKNSFPAVQAAVTSEAFATYGVKNITLTEVKLSDTDEVTEEFVLKVFESVRRERQKPAKVGKNK